MFKEISLDKYIENKTQGMSFTYPEFREIQQELETKHRRLSNYLNKRAKRVSKRSEEQRLMSRLEEIRDNKFMFDALKITHKRVYEMMRFILDSRHNILGDAEFAFKVAYESHYRDRDRAEPITNDILYFVNGAVKSIQEDFTLFAICNGFVWSYTKHPDYTLYQEDINLLIKFLDKYDYSMNYYNFEEMLFHNGTSKLLPVLMKKYNFYPHLADDYKTLVDIYNNRNDMSYLLDVFCKTKKEDALRYDSFDKWDDVANLLIDHTYERNNKRKVAETVLRKCSSQLGSVLAMKYSL